MSSEPAPKSTHQRMRGVDSFRAYAALAVVAIHAINPDNLAAVYYPTTAWLINQSGRFAVPFFYVLAGYFFARKLNTSADTGLLLTRSARRIGWEFVVWSIVDAITG